MLRLIQAEFLKLRRKKFIVLMLLSALFMPLLAVFYFRSADKTVIEPLQSAIQLGLYFLLYWVWFLLCSCMTKIKTICSNSCGLYRLARQDIFLANLLLYCLIPFVLCCLQP